MLHYLLLVHCFVPGKAMVCDPDCVFSSSLSIIQLHEQSLRIPKNIIRCNIIILPPFLLHKMQKINILTIIKLILILKIIFATCRFNIGVILPFRFPLTLGVILQATIFNNHFGTLPKVYTCRFSTM